MFFVVLVGTKDVAPPDEAEFFSLDHPVAQVFSDKVIGGISQHGGRKEDQHRPPDVQLVSGGKHAGGEKQAVAREEGGHHQAGFAEDDDKEQYVGQAAITIRKIEKHLAGIEKNVKKVVHIGCLGCDLFGKLGL